MKIYYLAFLLLFIQLQLFAQDADSLQVKDSIWTNDGSVNFSFSNVGLENWAGGGENSISFGILSDYKIERKTKASIWTTSLNLAYGIARVGNANNLLKKTDDQLLFNSNYNLPLNKRWNLTGYADFRTQFFQGHTYKVDSLQDREVEDQLISQFMAPGYLVTGLGISYNTKILKTTFAPLTSKYTFVLQDSLANAGAFGVSQGKRVRSEFGANMLGTLEMPVMDNISFKTNLGLFYNYLTPTSMDVNWETLLVLKVNDFFNTSFSTQLIYDDDVRQMNEDGTSSPKVQFKHVLNVNVGLSF